MRFVIFALGLPELIVRGGYWRAVLLPVGAFLLLSLVGLSSSSEADEPLFVRSAQHLERLWSGVLGCTYPGDGEPRRTFETTFEGDGVPSAVQHDYIECGKRTLRNTSSRILVNTMEDALRQGGVALFGERFRLDTGVGWVWGEGVTGDIEALIPILSTQNPDRTGQALFLQPGVVFWSGLEGEDRTDGNLGLVYRLHLTRDIVAGGSVFYDYDFRRGSQRLGLGLDMQSGVLHAAVNYYHPLNDWQQGRTGYVEQPLRGADFRLGLAWSRFEFDTSLGIWRFEGEETEEKRWSPAFDVEAGYRVFPGVFLQGGYGRHDSDGSLGSRWNVGLAFRFSLPELEGATSYGSMEQPDLWKLVKRERRLLYEERIDFAVRLSVENAIIAEPGSPGGRPATTTVTGVISGRDLREDETLEVVIYDSTTARYGQASDNDFTFSQEVYGVSRETGEQITSTGSAACTASPCRMGVPAGLRATNIEIELEALDDSDFQEIPEFIDIRVDVRDGSSNLVHSSNVARVTIRGHGNTVGFARGSDEALRENGGLAVVTVDVDLPSLAPMVLQVGATGTAERGTDYRVPANLVIPAGAGSATLTLTGINNEEPEGNKTITLALSGNLPEGWQYAASTHEITLLDDDLSVGFTGSDNPTLVGEGDGTVEINVAANQPLVATAAVAWSVDLGGDVTAGDFTGPTSGTLNFQQGDDRDDPQTILISLNDDTISENAEEVTVTLNEAGSSLPDGWSLGGSHTFSIDSNDGAVTFAADSTPLTINEGETHTARVNSTAEGPSNGYPLRISFSPSASGQISFPETLSLPAGRNTAAFDITVNRDDIPEESQTYTMTLSSGKQDPAGWTVSSTRDIIVPFSDGRISFAAASITAEEGGSSVETTLVMDPPPTSNTSIPMTIAGDAVLGADYTRTLLANGSNVDYRNGIVYPANAASVTFRVSAPEDDDEVGERATYRITGFPAGYSAGANTSLQVVLNDNDIGRVQFATGLDGSANEGERVFLRVQASTAATADLNLTWSASPSSEVDSPGSGTVTVRQGRRDATFDVTIANPGTDDPEGPEDVVVTLAASNLPAGWSLGDRATHTINIPANDRNITFSPTTATVLESAGHYDLTLSLNEASTVALPIRITAPPGVTIASPDAPGNWNVGSGTYTIPANSGRSAKVRLDFPEDTTYGDETYRITFSEGGNFPSTAGWGIVNTVFTLRVHDPEDSTVGFATGLPAAINEGETIRLGVAVTGGAPGVALPVDWSVNDPGNDLDDDSGRVTIPSGGTSVDIEIPIAGGDGSEDAESFTVTLEGGNLPPGFRLGTRTSHRFIINANENTITFGAPSAARINEEGSATITAAINLPIPAGQAATVTVTPSGAGGGSAAVRGMDYRLSVSHGSLNGNTWTLPTGRGSAVLTVTTIDTPSITVDRSFTLGFAGATLPLGWAATDTSRNITIANDDAPPQSTIEFSSAASSAMEGSPHTIGFTVQHVGTFTPFNVTVTAAGDTHNDDIRSSNTVSINTAQSPTWSINIHDSELIGNRRAVTLTLAVPSGWGLGAQTTHALTITPDTDTGSVAFAQGTSSVDEPANGTVTHNVPLAVSRMPADSFDLVIEGAGESVDARFGSSANDDANADSSVTVSSATISGTTLNIPVTIRADGDSEIDEIIVLTIPSRGNGLPTGLFDLGAQLTHRITIPANDNTVTFGNPSLDNIAENGGNATIAATISLPIPAGTTPAPTVTITPRQGTGHATMDVDYRLSVTGGSLNNNTWTLPTGGNGTLTVTAIDDGEDEGAGETVVLDIAPGVLEGWSATRVTRTITITDDDEAPVTGTIGFIDSDGATVSAHEEAEPDSGDAMFTVAVALSASPAEDVTVPVSVDSATTALLSGASVDVTTTPTLPASLTFAAGSTTLSQNITFTVHADNNEEEDKIVRLQIGGDASYTNGANNFSLGQETFTLTIPANDNTVMFANAPVSVVEGATGGSIEVVLSNNAPDGGLALRIEITGEEASFSNSSAQSVHNFTIAAGDRSSGEIPLYFPPDTDTNSEDVTLTLTADTDTAAFPVAWGTTPNVQHEFRVTEPDDTSITIGFAEDRSNPEEPETGSTSHTVHLNVIGTPPALADAFELTVTVEAASTADDPADYTVSPSLNAVSVSSMSVVSGGRLPLVFDINHDGHPEDAETIILALPSPTGAGSWSLGTNTTHTITIAANENSVGFASGLPTTAQEGETLALPVRLNAHAAQDFAFTVTSAGEDYRGNPLLSDDPDDYTHGSSIAFTTSQADDDSMQEGYQHTLDLEVTVAQNDGPENAEEFTITLELPGDVPSGFDTDPDLFTHTFTIPAHDNTVTFDTDENPASLEEGGSGQVHLLLSNALPEEFPVTITVSGDDDGDIAISGTGYSDGVLTIPPHAAEASFTVAADEDDDDTVSERITLTLTGPNPPGGWEVPANETYTFVIDDNDLIIGFAEPSGTFNEPDPDPSGSLGTVHNIKLQLSATPTEDLPVLFEFSGNASGEVLTGDYSAMESHTIRVADVDDDMMADYSFSILSDSEAELDETFTITLVEDQPNLPRGWGIDASNSSYTATIPANDNTVTFGAPSPARITEEVGFSIITAAVNMPLPAGEVVTINVAESGAPIKDYVISGTGYLNGVWTLPTEERNPELTIRTIPNTDDDGERTLSLTFTEASSPSGNGWAVTEVTRTITIEDNDGPNKIGFAETTLQLAEGDSVTLEGLLTNSGDTRLTTSGSDDLTINIAPSGDVAAINFTAADYTVSANTALARGETTFDTFNTTSDDIPTPGGVKRVTITMTAGADFPSSTWEIDPARSSIELVITDDDAGTVGFASSSSSATEGDVDALFEIPVTVSGTPASDFSLTVNAVESSGNDVADTDGDFTLVSETLNISSSGNADLSVQVRILADVHHERDETFILEISGTLPGGFSLPEATARHTVTILANENEIYFASSSDDSLDESNVGATATVTIQIIESLQTASSVLVLTDESGMDSANSNDYHITGTEYDSDTGVLTLPANTNRVDLTVAVVDDKNIEEEESIVLMLQERPDPDELPSGWDVIDGTRHTVTITDNDGDRNTIGFAEASVTLDEPTAGASVILGNPADNSRGVEHNVTLQLSAAPTEDITVYFEFEGEADGPGLAGDYSATASHTIVMDEDVVENMTADYPFFILADNIAEYDETFTISLADDQPDLPGEWGIDGGNNSYTVTILTNDNTIGFASYSDDSLDESDVGATAIVTIEIEQPLPPSESTERPSPPVMSVFVAPQSRSSTAKPADYTITGRGVRYSPYEGLLALPGGASSVELVVTVADDSAVEGEEKLVLEIAENRRPDKDFPVIPGWQPKPGSATHTITITDDESTLVGFSSPSSSAEEGKTNHEISFDINPPATPLRDFSMRITATGDIGAAGLTPGNTVSLGGATTSWTIGEIPDNSVVGDGSRTIELTIQQDDLPKEFRVDEDNNTHTLTITDDNDEGIVQFEDEESFASEPTEDHTVRLDVSAPPASLFNLVIEASGGLNASFGPSGDANVDATIEGNKFEVRINSDNAADGKVDILVDINGDDLAESNETITLSIPENENGLIKGFNRGARATHTINIPANGQQGEKKTIGFASPLVELTEGGDTESAMLQLRTPVNGGFEQFTGSIPLIPLAVTFGGDDNDDDFTIGFDNAAHGSFDPAAKLLRVSAGQHSNGNILLDVNPLEDDNAEPREEYIVTIAPHTVDFPGGWEVDTEANQLTVRIGASDNIISLTGPDAQKIFEGNTVDLRASASNPSALPPLGINVIFGFSFSNLGGLSGDLPSPPPVLYTFEQSNPVVNIPLPLPEDDVPEGRQKVTVTMTPSPELLPVGWSLGEKYTFTVHDDDGRVGFVAGLPETVSETALKIGNRFFVSPLRLPVEFGAAEGAVDFDVRLSGRDHSGNFIDLRTTRDATLGSAFFSSPPNPGFGVRDIGRDELENIEVETVDTLGFNVVDGVRQTKDILLSIPIDNEAELDETFTVTLSPRYELPDGVVAGALSHSVTVRAHGNTVGFADTSAINVTERRSTVTEVQLALTNPAPQNIVLTLREVVGNPAPDAGDYDIVGVGGTRWNEAAGTLTIPSGESTPSFGILANSDGDTDSETFTLQLEAFSLPRGWTLSGSDTSGIVTLTDNNAATAFVGFAQSSSRIEEGEEAEITLDFTNYTIPSGGQVFTFSVSGTADLTTDVMHDRSSVDNPLQVFLRASQNDDPSFLIRAEIDEDSSEPDETVNLTLTDTGLPDGVVVDRGRHVITISSHGNLAFFDSDDQTSTVVENAGETILKVTLDNPAPAGGLPLRLEATSGNGNGLVTFAKDGLFTVPPGESSHEVVVQVNNNGLHETHEPVTITLSQGDAFPTGWGGVNTANGFNTHTLVVTDDDHSTVEFVPSSSCPSSRNQSATCSFFEEPAIGHRTHRVAVRLSTPTAAGRIAVLVSATDGNALSGTDYTVFTEPQRLSFEPRAFGNGLVREAFFNIVADGENEGDEFIELTLSDSGNSLNSNGNYVELSRNKHIIHIPAHPKTIGFAVPGSTALEDSDHRIEFETAGQFTIPAGGMSIPFEVTGAGVGGGDATYKYDGRNIVDSETNDNDVVDVRVMPPESHGGKAFVEISITDDSQPEVDETITFTFGNLEATKLSQVGENKHEVTIPANDNRAFFSQRENSRTVSEDAGSTTFNISLTNPAPADGLPLLLRATSGNEDGVVSFMDGRAVNELRVDVRPSDGQSFPVTVYVVPDDGYDDETVVFTLTPRDVDFPDEWGEVSANENEYTLTIREAGRVNFANVSAGAFRSAEEGETFFVTVESTATANEPLPVVLTSNDGSDGKDDVTPNGGTFTILEGEDSVTFPVTIDDDSEIESLEDVMFTLEGSSLPVGWVIGTNNTLSFGIPANDRRISFSPTSARVLESAEHYDLAFLLNEENESPLPIRIDAPGLVISSPDAPGNWNATEGVYTIPQSSKSVVAKVRFSFTEDADNSENGYMVAFSEAPGFRSSIGTIGWGLATTDFKLTVEDPASGTVSFAPNNPVVVDEGDSITLRVDVSGSDRSSDVSLNWDVADVDGDIATDSGSVTIPAGTDFVQFTIPTTEDVVPEIAKSFTVTLGVPPRSFTRSTARGTHQFTVIDDDGKSGTVGFASAESNVVEGEGSTMHMVPVTVSAAPASPFNLSIDVVGEETSATRDTDFTIPATFRVSGSGDTSLVVEILDDTAPELGETVFLRIPDNNNGIPAGLSLDRNKATHIVHILPNDNTITFGEPSPSVITFDGEAESAVITATINQPMPAGKSPLVTVTQAGGDLRRDSDYSLSVSGGTIGATNDSNNWRMPTEEGTATLTVTALPGIASNETLTLDFTEVVLPTGWSVAGSTSRNIAIDAPNIVRLSGPAAPNNRVTEGDSISLRAGVTNPSNLPDAGITVTVSSDDGLAPLPVTRTLTRANPALDISLPVPEDRTPEIEEQVTVAMAVVGALPDDWELGDSTYTFTIIDNDNRVGFASGLSATASESPNAIILPVEFGAIAGIREVVFDVTLTGVDYDGKPIDLANSKDATLGTISAGTTEDAISISTTDTLSFTGNGTLQAKDVVLTIRDDGRSENTETFTVTLALRGGGGGYRAGLSRVISRIRSRLVRTAIPSASPTPILSESRKRVPLQRLNSCSPVPRPKTSF